MAKKKEVLNEPGFAVCNDTPLKFKSNAQVFNSRKNAECVLEQVTALSDPCPPTPRAPDSAGVKRRLRCPSVARVMSDNLRC